MVNARLVGIFNAGQHAFTGTEESDILHTADDWMKDHPMAQIRGLNLHEEDIHGSGDARTWVLEMTVDNTAAHF